MTDRSRIILERIAGLLSGGLDPIRVIEASVPTNAADAAAMNRRMALWEEYADEFGAQVIAIARVATAKGVKLFPQINKLEPKTERHFTLDLGMPINVTYTRRYFQDGDHFYFVGPGDPPSPHPLSGTGYWSHFCTSDAVAALGGPEVYVRCLADAVLAGKQTEFEAAFTGRRPEVMPRRKQPSVVPVVEPDTVRDRPPVRDR